MRLKAATHWTLALTLLACGADEKDDATGQGTVNVTAYGEEFIEDGIPADEMEDGWSVSFRSFQVTLRDVTVGETPVTVQSPIELASGSSGGGHAIGTATAPAGDHPGPAYTVAKITLDGSATKDATTKTFTWELATPVRYDQCDTTVSVPKDGQVTFQITIHADHLFAESLVSEDLNLRFQALADADTSDDGEITKDELQAADLGPYDPGNDTSINNLWAFLQAQAKTIGHVDGEGHCRATPTN